MAKLDATAILKYDSRQVVFYEMLMNGDKFSLSFDESRSGSAAKEQSFVITGLYLKTGSGNNIRMMPISFNQGDSAILNKIQTSGGNIYMTGKMDNSAATAWAKVIKSSPESDEYIRLSRLYKDARFKDGKTEYNRGDVAEGILSAALVARFMKEKPTDSVTKNDVEKVIATLGSYREGRTTITIKDEFTSPNKPLDDGMPIDDDYIIYTVGLAAVHMKAFLNGRVRATKMSGIYDAAVNYANSAAVKSWDKQFWENGRRDIITVDSQGLKDQKGTKKDIDVSFTDEHGNLKEVAMEISVKAAGVSQFSQRAGNKFATLQMLMGEFYFGDGDGKTNNSSCLSGIQQDYQKLIGKNIPQDIPGALRKAYKVGYDKAGGGRVIKWDKKVKRSFIDSVRWHAQKDQGEVPVLNLLDSGKLKYYDYNRLAKALEPYDWISVTDKEYTSVSGGNVRLPQHVINIHEDQYSEALPILKLRVKVETKPGEVYFRSVIESESKTGLLVGAEDLL